MAVIDQTLDHNGQSIYRIISSFGAPDFVKLASQVDLCGEENTPPHLFADMTRRKFPCHSPAATWMSAAFFHEKRSEYAPLLAESIATKINESARFFKIGNDVQALIDKITKAAETDETKLPDDTFAMVFDDVTGAKERRLPLRNAGEVKAAAQWLCKYRDDLPFESRRQIADKIMSKAVKFGADIQEQRDAMEKMAGLGACSAKDAVALINTRINIKGHTHRPSELQQEMQKLATVISTNPEQMRHFGMLTKLASIIDLFDRTNGLQHKYDTLLARPEDVLFGVTEKVAAELSDELIGNTLTGNYYKRADLQRLPVNVFGDSLGENFIDAVSTANAWLDTEKLARIIPTLPLNDAELFDAVVAENGVPPFAMKSAAAVRVPLADECQLAAMHTPAPGSLWSYVQ
jgi:hypothetical protein